MIASSPRGSACIPPARGGHARPQIGVRRSGQRRKRAFAAPAAAAREAPRPPCSARMCRALGFYTILARALSGVPPVRGGHPGQRGRAHRAGQHRGRAAALHRVPARAARRARAQGDRLQRQAAAQARSVPRRAGLLAPVLASRARARAAAGAVPLPAEPCVRRLLPPGHPGCLHPARAAIMQTRCMCRLSRLHARTYDLRMDSQLHMRRASRMLVCNGTLSDCDSEVA